MLTKEQIQQTVADYFKDKPVKRVYLFGSYARGEADEASDVDLLVDLDYEQHIGWQFFGWHEELKEVFDKDVDVVSSGGLRKDRLATRFIEEQKVLLYAKAIRDIDRLSDIEEAALFILKYTTGVSESDFYTNELLRWALLKTLENIGEAARQVSEDTKQEFSGLEWQQMISVRHFYVHQYFDVEWTAIWKTLQTVDFRQISSTAGEIITILKNRYSL